MKTLIPVILLGLGAAQAANAECSQADRQALEEWDKAWGKASEGGDRAALEKIYAGDYLDLGADVGGMDRNTAIVDAVASAERNRGKTPTVTTVPDNYLIHCNATTATITHRNVITAIGADNKPTTSYRRSVHVLEKRKGAWQVVSNAGNALSDADQLVYFELDWNAADVNRDVAWFERNLAHDYTSVSSRSGRLSRKSDDLEDMKKPATTQLQSAVLSDVDVRVAGMTAVVTGVNHVKGTDSKGQAFDRRIRFTDTFIRRDGRWLVWATQATEIAPAK